MEYGVLKDTVSFWLKPGLPDTIRVCVNYGDTLADTSKYVLSRALPEKASRRKEAAPKSLGVASNAPAGALDLYKNLRLNFALPLLDVDPEKLLLYTPKDTLRPIFSFTDSIHRQGEIQYKWLAGEKYELIIVDSAFCDLSGAYNDSTIVRFKVRNYEDYGVLLLEIALAEIQGQCIIQLMTDKEVVLEQQIISSSKQVKFGYLMPGSYKIKAIFDSNSNGKWDTGNYRENILPEKVEYYTTPLSIRANWDLKEDWKLE